MNWDKMTELEKAIEQIRKQVQSGRLQGQISKEWGQLLYENIQEALAISRVVGQSEQLPKEISDAEWETLRNKGLDKKLDKW